MKFKKSVQGVLMMVATITFLAIATTIESEWSKEYLVFAFANLSIFVGTCFALKKYGRWDD